MFITEPRAAEKQKVNVGAHRSINRQPRWGLKKGCTMNWCSPDLNFVKTAPGHVPLKISCALRKFYLSCKESEDEQETMRANDLGPRLITLILSNENTEILSRQRLGASKTGARKTLGCVWFRERDVLRVTYFAYEEAACDSGCGR